MSTREAGYSRARRLTAVVGVAALLAAAVQSREAAARPQGQPAQQPGTVLEAAEQLKIPTKSVWLGTVRVPRRVLADGKPLEPGRYRVRLTEEHAEAVAAGQAEQLERWVEFVQGGDVKGRELASIVPSQAVPQVAEARPPRSGAVRVEALKPEDGYLRLWFNHGGDQVLVHLPYATGT